MARKSESGAIRIRWLARRDMDEVLAIEQASFKFQWTEEDFLCCLRQRNSIGMVAEYRGQVCGFVIYDLHKSHIQILNFAVPPEYRRTGVGRAMIQRLIDKLSQQRRREIVAEVREGNLSAHLFLKACGFLAIAVTRGRYDDGEAAYVFSWLRISQSDAPPGGVNPVGPNRISQFFSDGEVQ